VTKWTPNEVTVDVQGARPGEHLVLNQNWDPGWSAKGHDVASWSDTVAATLTQPDGTVVFRYRPPTFWPGVALFFVTVGWIGTAYRKARRAAR
jgi:hypothetical protein